MSKKVEPEEARLSQAEETRHSGSCCCPKCSPEAHNHDAMHGEDKPDKRGITKSLKRRVAAHEAARMAMVESLKHPLETPDDLQARHRLAPSERRSPFEWGTLDWYRNELALAMERIELLEAERDRLLEEKRERDPILQKQIKAPSDGGNKGKLVTQAAASASRTRAIEMFRKLIATGDRDATEAIEIMSKKGWSKSALYRHLNPELERLGRTRKKPVKQKGKA